MNFSQLPFGLFNIKIFGIWLGVAAIYAGWVYYQQCQKNNFPADFISKNFWKWALSAIIIARTIALLWRPELWQDYGIVSWFVFWEGGLDLLGGVLGFAGAWYYDWKKQLKTSTLSPWRWLDLAALPWLKMLIIIDIGAFLTGTIYGQETSWWWGVTYETFNVEVLNPVHPITIYALLIHLVLWKWHNQHRTKWERKPGKTFMIIALTVMITSLALGFGRADAGIEVGFLRLEQWYACLGLGWLWWINKRGIKNLQ